MSVRAEAQAPRGGVLAHFHALDAKQHVDAIRRLAAAGMGDHEIARMTALQVTYVRQALGKSAQGSAQP